MNSFKNKQKKKDNKKINELNKYSKNWINLEKEMNNIKEIINISEVEKMEKEKSLIFTCFCLFFYLFLYCIHF